MAGLPVGAGVRSINGLFVPTLEAAQQVLSEAAPDLELVTDKGRVEIALEKYPPRSLSVYPTQIYSAIDAALLCLLLCGTGTELSISASQRCALP